MKPLCKADIARKLGISAAAVGMLLRAPDAPAPVGKGRYDLTAVKAFWQSRKALDKSKPTGTYAEELKAKTAAQRALLELELEIKRGQLVYREATEQAQREFVSVVQNDMLNAHTSLALRVVGKPVEECELEIKAFMIRMIHGWQKAAKSQETE